MDMSDDSTPRDLEQRLVRSLHATAPRPAADLADRLLRTTAAVEQPRGWRGLGFAPPLGAAAAVILAVVVGLQLGNLLPAGDQPDVGASSATAIPSTPSPTNAASPTIAPSPSAEVFPGGSRCTNETFGFTVGYPAGWWANEEIVPDEPELTPIPACLYFAEEPVELRPNAGLPPAIAITVGLAEEPLGDAPPPYEVVETRETTVDGRQATVEEIEMTDDAAPFFAAGDRSYGYRIGLPNGETLVVGTASTATLGDFESHKRILDQMMETLELIDA